MNNYIDVEVAKDGNYYCVKLISDKGIKYPIAMVKTSGEAYHIKEVEMKNINIS